MTRLVSQLIACVIVGLSSLTGCSSQPSDPNRIRVEVTGGHETNPVDRGRPVILIASALGVSEEVFRDAFSRVHPAPAGSAPSGDRVRENKEVLLAALGPHGVTNDRLDEVSNYYRYNRSAGEMWPTEDAVIEARLENGQIATLEIIEGGSGYTSLPSLTIPGHPEVRVEAVLPYGRDFDTNGAITTARVVR